MLREHIKRLAAHHRAAFLADRTPEKRAVAVAYAIISSRWGLLQSQGLGPFKREAARRNAPDLARTVDMIERILDDLSREPDPLAPEYTLKPVRVWLEGDKGRMSAVVPVLALVNGDRLRILGGPGLSVTTAGYIHRLIVEIEGEHIAMPVDRFFGPGDSATLE